VAQSLLTFVARLDSIHSKIIFRLAKSHDVVARENDHSLLVVVLLLRWSEPIYMCVGYVFESRFSAGTISIIFWYP